jgi:hypothetical protein
MGNSSRKNCRLLKCRWLLLQFQQQNERKTKMGKMKELYTQIISCEICEGSGISNSWVAPDGDYDFEWCECNPEHLIIDGEEII